MSPSMGNRVPLPSLPLPFSLVLAGWDFVPLMSLCRGEPGDGARVGEASAATAAWSAIARIAGGAARTVAPGAAGMGRSRFRGRTSGSGAAVENDAGGKDRCGTVPVLEEDRILCR